MNRREAIAALMALPATATISQAEVKRGDVIVVESDECLSMEEMESIQKKLNAVWPDSQIVVFDKALRMKVVRES